MGSYGLFVFLALGLYFLNRYQKQKLKDKELQQSLDQADPAGLKALGAMTYIAGVDGKIDATEIAPIHRICRENLGDIFDTDLITQVCNDAAANVTPEHFKDYAPDLTPEQHLKILKSAFQVASADGEISDKERDFLEMLSADMGISTEAFNTLLAENSTSKAYP